MAADSDGVICRIMQDYRHLMTEPERAADRAFALTEKLRAGGDPDMIARTKAAIEQALSDPATADLFARGRRQFLNGLQRRILAEHGASLPRCIQCGEVLKQPNPKQCFDCDYGR